jgi:oligosaccharide repeat unit polymerase
MSTFSIIICGIICASYVFLSIYQKNNCLFKPGFAVSFVFFTIQLLTSFGFYNLHQVSDRIYGMCLVSVICFLFGTFIANKTVTTDRFVERTAINYNLTYILIIIAIVSALPFVSNMIESLKRVGIDALLGFRESAVGGEGILFANTTSTSFFFFDLFINALCFTMPAICSVDMTHGKKDKKVLIGTIAILIIKTLFTVNRATIFYAVLIFYIVFKFNGGKVNLSRIQKVMISLLAVAGLGAVIYITNIRSYMSFDKSIYKYFAGPLPNLDLRIGNIEQSGLYTIGFASTRGIYNKVLSIIKTLSFGIIDYPSWYVKMGDLLNVESSINIGSGLNMNAFVTPIYSLYLDGRWAGVIIGMIVYGYISQKVYIRALRNHNFRNDSVYALFMLGLYFSFIRMQFSNNGYAWGLLFALLITNPRLNGRIRLKGFSGK